MPQLHIFRHACACPIIDLPNIEFLHVYIKWNDLNITIYAQYSNDTLRDSEYVYHMSI